MRIVLRILVVLVLLAAGAALYLGIILFGQREELKARTALQEQYFVKLSRHVERDQAQDLAERQLATVDLQQKDLKRYFKLGADGKPLKVQDLKTQKMVKVADGPETMKFTLDALLAKAELQTKRLDDTRLLLQDTRKLLEETHTTLRSVRGQLAAALTRVENVTDELQEAQQQTIDQNMTIDTLNDQVTDLNGQVATRDEQIVKLQDQQSESKRTIGWLEQRISDLKSEIERLRQTPGQHAITPGDKGTILTVNPEWNFVVIGTQPETQLARGAELIVRRGDRLISKVKVRDVKTEENVAVADIMNEWQQMPIQKGDSVVY